MPILNEYELHQLAILSYVEFHETIENKREALVAMKVLPHQGQYSDKEYARLISNKLEQTLDDKYGSVLDSLCIIQQNTNNKIEINLPVDGKDYELEYKIGSELKQKINFSDTKQIFDFEGNPMQREINGVLYQRRSFEIPQETLKGLDFNYHKIRVAFLGEEISSQLAYAPEKCYQPIDIDQEKLRGTSVGIPSIRSSENIGMGNYSDLAQFAHIMAEKGLDIIGTLPIHAMPHHLPESASPYSPISRSFFNFGYLDVTAIDEFRQSKKIQQIYDSVEFEEARRKNQSAWKVDYTTSYELQMLILQECYEEFVNSADENKKEQFAKYKGEKEDDLQKFALFQALCEHFSGQNPPLSDWRDWPEEFQNSNSLKIKEFSEKNQQKIDFFAYLQWETIKQIRDVQETCKKTGMKIGLYTDLAVGTIPSGFESWAYKDVYIDGSLGIPPDMCSAEGQNWGIVGYNPSVLEKQGFKPFINMMSSNMLGGMLRIDCPLCGFVAANLIPNGKTAKECFSVYMPTDKMLALTALTSHLTKTPIVFEDLGAIPHHFREKIQKMNGITYKVLPYERCSTRDFPAASIVVSSTHDSDSLAIGWTGESAYILASKNCLPEKYINSYLEDAYKYRQHMAGLLVAEKCIDNINPAINYEIPQGYFSAVAKLIGNNEHCTSAYGIMPIADILGLSHWRENLPGTAELHNSRSPNAKSIYSGQGLALPNSNWRNKLPLYLNEIAINPRVDEVCAALSNADTRDVSVYERKGRNESPRRDPKRLTDLYIRIARSEEAKIAKDEEPRFTKTAAYKIWGAKFSAKKKQQLQQKAQEQSKSYNDVKKAIDEYKKNYRNSQNNIFIHQEKGIKR